MRSLAGLTLGAYRLIEPIGQGGMAIIYKAYDPALDRFVAIKILPEYLSHEPEFSSRFLAEARNVARLHHPNILPIYGSGQEGGLSYFVMALVEGGTLRDIMGSPLAIPRIVTLISQVSDALQYAHQQGIVHRDVKPANILLPRPDWALLADFGIARVLESTAPLTRSQVSLGTPHYMAPEQARGERVGSAADQYAVGIILYEMLTGASPFQADTPQAILYQHMYSDPPPVRSRNSDIPESLQRVVHKALAKRPYQRYPDMAAFAAALHGAAQGPAASTTGPLPTERIAPMPAGPRMGTERITQPQIDPPPSGAGGPSSTAQVEKDRSRLRRALLVVAAFALIVVAVLAFAVTHGLGSQTAVLPPTNTTTPTAAPAATATAATIASPQLTATPGGSNGAGSSLGPGPASSQAYSLKAAWGSYGVGHVQFDTPKGIAVDAKGDIYVADTNNNWIQKLSPTGAFLKRWGSQGSGNGQFDNPQALAVDSQGTVYVADDGNSRIQEFSSSGNFLGAWGSDTISGTLYQVALDNAGNVYVAAGSKLYKFGPGHNLLQTFINGFNSPVGVAVDKDGTIYVADSDKEQIVKLSPGGDPLDSWQLGVQGQSSSPSNLALDGQGNLYVLDTDAENVQKYSTASHKLLATIGNGQGSDPGQISNAYGLAADPQGTVYVADSGNNRIEKFAAGGS